MNKKNIANMLFASSVLMSLIACAPSYAFQISKNIDVVKWKALWIVVPGFPAKCAPATAFIFKNIGTTSLGELMLTATFLNTTKKEVFSAGTNIVNNNGEIPPSYTYGGIVYGSTGYPVNSGRCSEKLPKLQVNVRVNNIGAGFIVSNALRNTVVRSTHFSKMPKYSVDISGDAWVRKYVFDE